LGARFVTLALLTTKSSSVKPVTGSLKLNLRIKGALIVEPDDIVSVSRNAKGADRSTLFV